MRICRTKLGILSAAGLCLGLAAAADAASPATATPIQHVVVIFQENVSFDHYFATYPTALNPKREPLFIARPGTPTVNGLGTLVEGQPDGVLLINNPNALNPLNADAALNPFRLGHGQASTCDQDHNYGHEQAAFDQGLMDLFPLNTGVGESSFCDAQFAYGAGKGLVMGYFDGNTVTSLWNYAQTFAMSDNSYSTTFGPSTPGVLNLVAGNTYPALPTGATPKVVASDATGAGTLVGDLDPTGDICSTGTPTIQMGGQSIADLLNAQGITWGSFMGGFDLTVTNADGSTGCNRQSPASASNNGPTKDYIPHHAFFQYWASTLNPQHTRPKSVMAIGTAHDGGANHEYDIHDFFDAMKAGNMPAVSFLKAPAFEDGHAGYSDPLLEQKFLVQTIDTVMKSDFWPSTAIIVLYDDSDGWYDHQMGPIVNSSAVNNPTTADGDALNGVGVCGHGAILGNDAGTPIQGRCGYGMRQPLLVISPFAKANFVDHTLTDQASVLRFIEDNWGTGRIGGCSFDQLAGTITNMFDFGAATPTDRLLLDPATGSPQ